MLNRNKLMISTLLPFFLFSFTISAIGEDLTEQQQALQAEIEHNLVAPCCWNMTVDQHDSQASRQVRAKITELIKEGKGKEEILAYFSSQPQYGERILAKPSQESLLGKFAYWMIPIAFMFGIVIVAVVIKHLSRTEAKKARTQGQSASQPNNEITDLEKQVEEELKQFD